MANVYNTVYKKGNVRVPIKVHLEKRMDYRFSIAKRSAILRMPSWFLKKQRTKTYDKFIAWLENHHNNTPDMFTRFEIKQYQDGDDIILFGETYTLDISVSDTNRVQAKVIEDGLTIYIMIPVDLGDDRDLHVTSILKKIIPKALKPKVEARLAELAANVVGVKYNNFRLKDSLTNWGSCSGKNNINISIRTLLLPMEMIDYVLIHELCHLIELNHSPAYWANVEKAMPEYKRAENWISAHGNKYYF